MMGRKGPKIEENDELIFKRATNSQYSSTLYNQLKKDKRLNKFIAALEVCGLRGMSLRQSCEYLSKLFPGYVRGKGLLPKTLAEMIAFYPDLNEAFGFSMDVNEMLVHKRAMTLAETTDDIDIIEKYHKMYSDGNCLYRKEEKVETSPEGGNTSGTQINFFNSRSESVENE